jgi:hypothetical protein
VDQAVPVMVAIKSIRMHNDFRLTISD